MKHFLDLFMMLMMMMMMMMMLLLMMMMTTATAMTMTMMTMMMMMTFHPLFLEEINNQVPSIISEIFRIFFAHLNFTGVNGIKNN